MKTDLILALIEAAPTVIGDVEEAVVQLKSDASVALKVKDGVTALQHLVADLQNVLSKL